MRCKPKLTNMNQHLIIMETPLSHEQSLQVIGEMIQRTKVRYERGAGTPMIYWGVATVGLIALFLVLGTLLPTPLSAHWVWWAFIPVAVAFFFIQKKKETKKPVVTTQIDRIIKTMAVIFAATQILFWVTSVALVWSFRADILLRLWTPTIFLFSGSFLLMVGAIIRQREFGLSGIVFLMGAVVQALLYIVYPAEGGTLTLCVVAGGGGGGFAGHPAQP